MAAWTWTGGRKPHRDPAPFTITTSVGPRRVKVCTLCAALVLAEEGPHGQLDGEWVHIQHHARTDSTGVAEPAPAGDDTDPLITVPPAGQHPAYPSPPAADPASTHR